jgi:uncharacterized membrane protein
MLAWMLAIPLLGITTGLRSMAPMAVVCWFAHLGYLPVDGTWAAWAGWRWVVIAWTVLALAEMVADKMPWMPDRISKLPLLWRLLMGGLAGAIAATGLAGSVIEGIVLAEIGTLLGAFGGYMVRCEVVEKMGAKDWQFALAEDAFTIAAAAFALHVITG